MLYPSHSRHPVNQKYYKWEKLNEECLLCIHMVAHCSPGCPQTCFFSSWGLGFQIDLICHLADLIDLSLSLSLSLPILSSPSPFPSPFPAPHPIAFFMNQSRDREYMTTSLPPLGPLPNNMADTQMLSPVSLILSPESRSTQISKQPSAVTWSWRPKSWIWGFSLTFSFVVSSGRMTARKRHLKTKRIYPDAKSGETAEPRRQHSSGVLVLQKHRK